MGIRIVDDSSDFYLKMAISHLTLADRAMQMFCGKSNLNTLEFVDAISSVIVKLVKENQSYKMAAGLLLIMRQEMGPIDDDDQERWHFDSIFYALKNEGLLIDESTGKEVTPA